MKLIREQIEAHRNALCIFDDANSQQAFDCHCHQMYVRFISARCIETFSFNYRKISLCIWRRESEWVRETRREIWNWFRNFIQKYLKEMMMMHCMGKGGKAIYFSSILQAHKNHKNCCQRLYIHVIPSIFGGGRVKSFSQFFCISKLISFDKYMENSCAFLLELDLKWMFLKKVLFLILQLVKII